MINSLWRQAELKATGTPEVSLWKNCGSHTAQKKLLSIDFSPMTVQLAVESYNPGKRKLEKL